MQNAGLDKAQTGIKIAGRDINNFRYAVDTTLTAESKEELKSLLMKVKEENEKAGLKLNIQWRRKWQPTPVFLPGKVHGQRSLVGCSPWGYMTWACMHEGGGRWVASNKLVELKKNKNKKTPQYSKTEIMADRPITSWQTDGETMETLTNLIFLGSKTTVDGNCSHEIKRRLLLGRKAMTNLSSVQLLSHVWLFVTPWTPTGFPAHHQRLEHVQTHVHQVGDATQPSHPLSSPSPPAFNLSPHQGLFKWVSSSHRVAKVPEFQHFNSIIF